MLESWGPLHKVRLESGETAEARAHTTTKYDEGRRHSKKAKPAPRLPTKETVATADHRERRRSNRASPKPITTGRCASRPKKSSTPSGLNLRTVRSSMKNRPGCRSKRRLPAKPEGGDAHTTKTVYYSAQEQSPESACRNKPAWANLPCKVLPAAQASPAEGNPQLLVKRVRQILLADEPEEVIESAGGSEEAAKKRTMTIEYDSAGRPKWRKISGGGTGGTSIPAVETLYNSSTGAPETQQFVCRRRKAARASTPRPSRRPTTNWAARSNTKTPTATSRVSPMT